MTYRRRWQWGKIKEKVNPPVDSFTGADKETVLKGFLAVPENTTLWNRLEETKETLPWLRSLVNSLQTQAGAKGALSDKQRSLATSLYLDACITTNDKVFEQQEARKLGYRLMRLNLGRVQQLVSDIMYRTESRPFSLAQIRAFQNIAQRQRVKLTQIPKLTSETFDGWNEVVPKTHIDNESGS